MEAMECDVLVIGGGPAGSTAAALLAQRGRDVVLLEKMEHPRRDVRDPLLPPNAAVLERPGLLDRLGVRDAVTAGSLFKHGAAFVDQTTGHSTAFHFAGSPSQPAAPAARALDEILFDNARAEGVSVYQRTRVTDVLLPEPGVRAWVTAEKAGVPCAYAPRYVLDATGRDTLLAAKLGLKRSSKPTARAALQAHWHRVRRQGDVTDEPGFITVHLVEDGWFWMIPLPGGTTSIGFVGDADAFKFRFLSAPDRYRARLRHCPAIAARMADATLASEIHGAGHPAYRGAGAWGDGYMMLGDAFAFMDPVFSSGVLLAMTAAELAADVADTWLDNPARARVKAHRRERTLRQTVDSLGWLATRINTPVLREMLMSPSGGPRVRDGLVAMLTGDVRTDGRPQLPVLAFKSAYYALTALRRVGVRAQAEPRMLAAE